jgi:hypothetical protein
MYITVLGINWWRFVKIYPLEVDFREGGIKIYKKGSG